MLNHESPYDDRTPDLIDRVRKLREAAEQKMNAFGNPAEYETEILRGRNAPAETRNDTATGSATSNPQDGARP
ncbi:MAG: hypothetical protein ACP5EP_12725 [Acidobacteriaceae bacterium]